jgi:hypothetical protein
MKSKSKAVTRSPWSVAGNRPWIATFNLQRSTLTAVALAALVLTGCQVLTYTGPTGEKFMRGSVGAKTAIASLSVDSDTNGVRHLELKQPGGASGSHLNMLQLLLVLHWSNRRRKSPCARSTGW